MVEQGVNTKQTAAEKMESGLEQQQSAEEDPWQAYGHRSEQMWPLGSCTLGQPKLLPNNMQQLMGR